MIEYEYEFSIPVCRPYIIASLIPILSLEATFSTGKQDEEIRALETSLV